MRASTRPDPTGLRCRLQILTAVVDGCRQSSGRRPAGQSPAARRSVRRPDFSILPIEERLAVILVDMLALSYAGAAAILRVSSSQIAQLLARGRCKMI